MLSGTQTAAVSNTQTAPVSKKRLWAGRILSALPVLMLLFSGVLKLIKPAPVVEEFTRLGYPESLVLGIGAPRAGLHCRLCDSAYFHYWGDLADSLFGRRNRYPRAYRRSILQPDRSRRAGLGRAFPAR